MIDVARHKPECEMRPKHMTCICIDIELAEKRVGNVISALLVGGHDWRQGYFAGLDAAREAVAALDIGRDVRFSVDVQADALAAIDALKEKP